MSILTQPFAGLARKLLDGILPNYCLLCGADSRAVICGPCAGDLPPLPEQRCPRCAEPAGRGETCGQCLTRPPHFDGTVALYRYDFPLDRLIQDFKYGSQLALGGWFGEGLARALTDRDFDILVPLPLHPERLRQRGYNQAGELARVIARRLGRPLDLDHLQRTRPTSPQAELPLEKRAANVRGAFECMADFSGRHILLVDDVMTTGATLDEAARTLKLHGAAGVTVAVVARALRHR